MVLIASDSAIRGSHSIPAYSVVKAGVVVLAELLARRGRALRHPRQRRLPRQHAARDGRRRPGELAATASGAFATADDVASAVVFLASRDAAHINGATLRIDGGTGAALQAVTRS